jgi:hypothetical protein
MAKMVLNLSEAAKFVRVSPTTVLDWLSVGLVTPPKNWDGSGDWENVTISVQQLRQLLLIRSLREVRVPIDVLQDNLHIIKKLSSRPFMVDIVIRVDFAEGTIDVLGKNSLPNVWIGANTVVMGLPVEPDFARLYTENREAYNEQGE